MVGTVILRADAGPEIGYGHFVRSCALAGYLANDFHCLFMSFNHSGEINDFQRNLLKESGATLIESKAKTREEFDAEFLATLASLQPDVAVLDNYYFSTDFQREVKVRCGALVSIDDVPDRHFVSDLLITVCPFRREDFSLEPYTEFLGGPEWLFLRKPFLDSVPPVRDLTKPVKRVMIAMGGADPKHISARMAKAILNINPEIEVDIVAGPSVQFQSMQNMTVHRQLDAEGMRDLMDAADVGVFPASGVCIEAMSRRLPVITGFYADNQIPLYLYFEDWHQAVGIGDFSALGKTLLSRLEYALNNPGIFKNDGDIDFLGNREYIINQFKRLCRRGS